jgi:hypothetical protein
MENPGSDSAEKSGSTPICTTLHSGRDPRDIAFDDEDRVGVGEIGRRVITR